MRASLEAYAPKQERFVQAQACRPTPVSKKPLKLKQTNSNPDSSKTSNERILGRRRHRHGSRRKPCFLLSSSSFALSRSGFRDCFACYRRNPRRDHRHRRRCFFDRCKSLLSYACKLGGLRPQPRNGPSGSAHMSKAVRCAASIIWRTARIL